MNKFQIKKATKKASKLRLAFIGLSGGGKTWKSLALATSLGKRVVVIDTERGSASKYSDQFDFDVLELETHAPPTYVEAIGACVTAGYEVVVIDSLSHAWMGKEGALETVDRIAKRQGGNSFGAWRDVTPQHNALVDAILRAPVHVIVTLRAKMEYAQEKDERTGKTVVRKVGLQAVQRDGLEYEFDVVADVDQDHNATVTKTRCSALADKVIPMQSDELARALSTWLTDGAPAEEPTVHPADNPKDSLGSFDAPPRAEAPAAPSITPELAASRDRFTEAVKGAKSPQEIITAWMQFRGDAKALGPEGVRCWNLAKTYVGTLGEMTAAAAHEWMKSEIELREKDPGPPDPPTPTAPTPGATSSTTTTGTTGKSKGGASGKTATASATRTDLPDWLSPSDVGMTALQLHLSEEIDSVFHLEGSARKWGVFFNRRVIELYALRYQQLRREDSHDDTAPTTADCEKRVRQWIAEGPKLRRVPKAA